MMEGYTIKKNEKEQVITDFAKRMEAVILNESFTKKEAHRLMYESDERFRLIDYCLRRRKHLEEI